MLNDSGRRFSPLTHLINHYQFALTINHYGGPEWTRTTDPCVISTVL